MHINTERGIYKWYWKLRNQTIMYKDLVIYIYIYIVIYRQTALLYYNSSVWLDMYDAWSWDRNPPNFTLDRVSDRSDNKRTTSA